jgi:hypothetical protein
MAEARPMSDMMDTPIMYVSGKVVFSRQFTTSAAFLSIVPLLEQSRERAEDVGMYLFFVYSYASLYRGMPEEDRLRTAILDGRFKHQDWLLSVLDKEEVEDLVSYYCEVALTPSQRLYQSLVDAMERWQRDIAAAKGDGDLDPIELVDRGLKLHEKFAGVDKMIREESSRRVRSDYKPRRFEARPTRVATRKADVP